ncbi:hypothetical protein pdam_00009642 [Pocillopora damicornis]|uniref:Uncharacterized protein n=1 Tax=Pocillopora damicornis TaxID=46731 RepID=A0A3M6UAR6_POCDA|nr:hypothetical protein pdam_00009642 [Pocillopora damicornis]
MNSGTNDPSGEQEVSGKKNTSLHKACPRGPLVNQPKLIFVTKYGKWKIGNIRSDMAMFAMKKLLGFCMDFVL